MRKLLPLLLLLAGCPKPTSQIDSQCAATTVNVTVGAGNSIIYSPANVTIRQGDTVTWTWGSSGHSITSGSSCMVDNKFCSQTNSDCSADALQNSGDVYSHTFTDVGTFPYHCAAHCSFGMTGSVTVLAACSAVPDAGTVADSGPADAGAVDAGTVDAGPAADAGCTDLTVLNFENWCSVSVAGGTSTTAASQSACVPAGTVSLSATPASSAFILGDWFGTTGAGTSGSPGTVTGTGATAVSTTTATVSGSTACVSICCPFTNGSGCPSGNQCP